MEFTFAQKLASKYVGLDKTKTLCVTSDGGVFINNDISFMREYAKERNLKIFVFKDEQKVQEENPVEVVEEKKEVVEPVKEDKPKKEKKKQS